MDEIEIAIYEIPLPQEVRISQAKSQYLSIWLKKLVLQPVRNYEKLVPITFLTYCLYFSVEEKKIKKKNEKNNFISFTEKRYKHSELTLHNIICVRSLSKFIGWWVLG